MPRGGLVSAVAYRATVRRLKIRFDVAGLACFTRGVVAIAWRLYIAYTSTTQLDTRRWERGSPPPYSPGLAPSDIRVFEGLRQRGGVVWEGDSVIGVDVTTPS